MAAKWLPGIGKRCHIFVHDFSWDQLPYILGRLTGGRLLVPDPCVIERCGYLSPFYTKPYGAFAYSVLPCAVDLPPGPVSYDGPLLHLATINPWKGHADLLMAVHRLKESGRPLQLHSYGMVAVRAVRERLDWLIERLQLEDSIALHDYLPDPGLLLHGCRAVVVSSVAHSGGPESFGRTIIEAWAFRKPVVAYATGAPASLISHEVDGLLVPEGDIEALAAALHRVASDPVLCRRLGEAGYKKAVETYQSDKVARALFSLLAEPNACAN
jgi:glycosyltransferase involved in cell wall biosynthesis